MKKPIISIIGRPNVGKSTLVNRLAGERKCIVGEIAGITRDRNYIDIDWNEYPLTIVDTGGITFDTHSKEDRFSKDILEQVQTSMQISDAIIFLVDGTSGITKLDFEISQFLRKESKVPVYLAVNKVDSPEREKLLYDFYELGIEKMYPISAMHGSRGLGDLLDDLIKHFYTNIENKKKSDDDEIIKIAFIGKPNVGKSSLFNKLVGEDRTIVSNVSGTTRDSINIKLKRHGSTFELIDTAGLRRKSKVKDEVEKYSNIRAIQSIEECDIAILIVDSTEDEIVTEQDQKIASLIIDRGKACVIAINKWDIFENKEDKERVKKFKSQLSHKLRFIDHAPKEYISALTGQRTDRIWKLAADVREQSQKRISTGLLNKIISDILMLTPPPVVKQKAIKIKYVSQVGICPPCFVFFVNHSKIIPESYKRFLERQMREYFGFYGTPIVLRFKTQEK